MRKLHFKFLDYLFEDIYEVKSKEYPDSRFWKKNDNVELELENPSTLWVLDTIWKDVEDMFSLDRRENRQLIREWIKQHLNLTGFTPITNSSGDFWWWRNI